MGYAELLLGCDLNLVLNEKTSDGFFGGKVSLCRFPTTLQDRALGLRFLWIDALSIMQDSAEDWTAEAGHMKDVYGGVTINIAATNLATTDNGMFKNRAISPGPCKNHFSLRAHSHMERSK